MKSFLLSTIFFAAAVVAVFASYASAQFDGKKAVDMTTGPAPGGEQKSRKEQNRREQKRKNQKREKADIFDLSSERSEAGEAARFLNEIEKDFLNLKIYKLADTDADTVAPQISGSVITSGKEAKKFQKIVGKVLKVHRLDEICSGVLFEDKSPMIFTYRLRTISFSTAAFDLFSKDEIAALIAHEVGHIYLAKELLVARAANDNRTARIIELKCDAVALLTLKKLKIDPQVLIKALQMLITAREKLGLQTMRDQSASMADRIKLTEYFLKQR